MLITFVRHGQSEHNAGLTANLDSSLTSLGKKQSQATSRRFESEGFTANNTAALVSPLLRTLQTLEPSARLLNLKPHLFYDVREFFSSRNEGYKSFVGLPIAEIRLKFPWVEIGQSFDEHKNWWPSIQEDELQLYSRSCTARDNLISSYFHSDKQVLIVSHADPIGRMIEAFLRIPPNLDGPPWSGNCGVTRLELINPSEPAELLLMNDLSHLYQDNILSPR